MSAASPDHQRPRHRPARRPSRRATRRATAALALLLTAVAATATAPTPAAAAPGDHCFVIAAHQTFLGRQPTADELASWKARLDSGTHRSAVPRALATSDEWLAREVAKIYQQALDRGPDAAGLAYWTAQLRAGAKVTRIASLVYGSPEFYARAGGTPEGFVTDAYRRILHRTPSTADLAYWVAQLSLTTRGAVAADLVASRESRTDRVTALYRDVLGRGPDAAGLEHWVQRLAVINDVELAIHLASSAEYLLRAQQGCTEPPPTGSYDLHGRGNGHGRGMGQWGALGYAVDHGWSATEILDHFYGGTGMRTNASDPVQRVYLQGSAGGHLTVTQAAGRLRVTGHGTDYASVSVRRLSATAFRIYASRSVTCDAGAMTLIQDGVTLTDVRIASSVAQGDDASRMLRDCRTGRRYRGALHQVRRPGDAATNNVTVNEVGTEALLRGIVPREVSPSWADKGGGRGAAAVRAQAVAARSYVLAGDTRWGTWATTCDSTQCQAYEGFGVEDPRTDLAILATARTVRAIPGGPIARTEFSSSSGGWTAGGVFPAVRDDGDDYVENPHHTWTETRSKDQIERAFPGRGAFLGFADFVRDGNGPQGGRIVSARLRFTGGDVTRTGEQLRSDLGLRSSWWSL